MADSVWFVLAIVLVALAFDFVNGFHDSANSIAAVAKTIAKGIVDPSIVDSSVMLATLIGAITWDLITWYGGIPSSSSHALVGGLAGAAISKAGFAALVLPGKWVGTVSFIFLAPVLGLVFALTLTVALSWLLRRALPRRVDKAFRVLQ